MVLDLDDCDVDEPDEDECGARAVVSTLILLVEAVLLAGSVTYFATNVVSTRSQVEDVQVSFEHVWVNSTGAVGAFKIKNLGGRDLLLNKIMVRGVESSWSDVYLYRVPSGTSVTSDLTVVSYASLTGATVEIGSYNYTQASGDVPLPSGGALLVYIKDPDNVQVDDIGTAIEMAVQTSRAQYISVCNVESATQ